MPPIRRRLRAAAFVLICLAAAGAPALAQNETSNTIGPPQLKDFSLPGQRTTPPAASPPPATAAPRVTEPRTPPVTAPRTPSPAADPASERPAPRTAAPAARSEPAAPEPAPPPAGSVPVAPVPVETAPAPEPQSAAPAPAEPGPRGASWFWPAAGGALALLLAAFLLLRRRRARAEAASARDSARKELGGALFGAAAPEPAAEPQAAAAVEPPAPRPWLELDIVPERAAATDSEAYVRYALTLTNQGDSEARNIRIDPRLFNAGAEGEMMDFFQGPIHEQSGSPHVVIAPGQSLKLNGEVAMPKADLREIELAGRRIFVPMVAINVAYDWAGGGGGRTSRSWLVGREAQTPTEKMGPFRLDLGPRIYRSVGRREARLVRV